MKVQKLSDHDIANISSKGWRQGALFRPNDYVQQGPDDPQGAFFIVLTQTCTLVNPSLKNNPWIEIATAKPVEHYNPKDPAARGKTFHKYHLQLKGADHPALEIDINSRRFVDRKKLLEFGPDGPVCDPSDCYRMASWMARYYTRVALPNALVGLLKDVFVQLRGILDSDYEGAPLHEDVDEIFIDWAPDDEHTNYTCTLTILANDQAVTEQIDRLIGQAGFTDAGDYLELKIEVLACDATFVSDLRGRKRLSEFDYLSIAAE
jgi:hypothetical protein